MKAGPKLDALVAEKVMGLKVALFPNIDVHEAYDEYGNSINIGQEFKPSTDISDAWIVIEKIKRKGFNFFVGDADTGEYDCVFGKKGFHRGVAETAPLAICLAALKSFGVDVE